VRHCWPPSPEGFSDDELVTAGLVARNDRGPTTGSGRLLWPIREVPATPSAFGARRLFDDDRIEAKYLNTPETPVYKKSHLLYGVDLRARRSLAPPGRRRRGYTDVMACHLSGVGRRGDLRHLVRRGPRPGATAAVARPRRVPREVIFTFDVTRPAEGSAARIRG